MKKVAAILTAAVFLVVASPSFATGSHGGWKPKASKCWMFCGKKWKKWNGKKYKGKKKYHHKKPKAVPEIDAAGAAISLALVAGVVSIGRERRKRQLAK